MEAFGDFSGGWRLTCAWDREGYIGFLTTQPTLLKRIGSLRTSDPLLCEALGDLVLIELDSCLTNWSIDSGGYLRIQGRLYVPDNVKLKKDP